MKKNEIKVGKVLYVKSVKTRYKSKVVNCVITSGGGADFLYQEKLIFPHFILVNVGESTP